MKVFDIFPVRDLQRTFQCTLELEVAESEVVVSNIVLSFTRCARRVALSSLIDCQIITQFG
jgi:hypothetical protein